MTIWGFVGDLETVEDFVFLHEFSLETNLTMHQVRYLIQMRKTNGADFFLRRFGKKKWMASPELFYRWVNERGEEVVTKCVVS